MFERLLDLLRPAARDPRHLVTPDAFEVAEDLLGQPLASPWRRGMALLADLVLIALLTEAGPLFFSLVAAVAFFVVVTRRRLARWWTRLLRAMAAFAGAVVIFLVVVTVLYSATGSVSPPYFPQGNNPYYTGMDTPQWIQFSQIQSTQDPEERARATEELLASLQASGVSLDGMQPVLDSLDMPPGAEDAFVDLFDLEPEMEVEPPAPEELAALLESYAAALRAGDEERVAELSPRVEDLAGSAHLKKRVERLRVNIRELYSENRRLREEVDHPTLLRMVSATAADLGLTLGWGGVYFTLFLAGWRGRTPGKFLFRLRVVKLDRSPITLWTSFERFAGYAAGLATGLLGFLQILWDANRQGMQDKIVGTVVVVEPSRWS